MSIEINNESGVEVRQEELVRLIKHILSSMHLHPQTEVSVILADVETMERLHIEWMDEPATREVMRVHQELLSHSEWNERLRAAMASEYGRWWAAYVRLFRELAEAGRLTAGADVDVLGVAFATLSDGLVSQRSLDPALDTEAIMRGFLQPFLVTDRGDRN